MCLPCKTTGISRTTTSSNHDFAVKFVLFIFQSVILTDFVLKALATIKSLGILGVYSGEV